MEAKNYMNEMEVPAIGSFQELIDHLRLVFASDKVNVDYVKAVLASYKSNPQDWKMYAKFDKYRYTRNLVDSGNGKYNLIALCWGEGQGSSVHDHSDAHCFVKVLDGQLKETMFECPPVDNGEVSGESCSVANSQGGGLVEIGAKVYERDGVTYINDSIGLHRVENPSHTEPAVSLHLYSPPFEFCRTFDERTGASKRVEMTFWSKYGQQTSSADTVNHCSQVSEKPSASAVTISATA